MNNTNEEQKKIDQSQIERLNKIYFNDEDYLKTINITSTIEEKKAFITSWIQWLKEEEYWNPKFLAKRNEVHWVSLERIFEIQASKKISDIHLTRWDLVIMKVSWNEIRVWLEYEFDETFKSEFWRKKLEFNDTKKLCFDFLDFKSKETILREWSIDTNYRMIINWELTTFRLSIYLNNWAISLVSRYINPEIWDIEKLFSWWLPLKILDVIWHSSWLVLVTWPMASWKSYTLATILEHINLTKKKHITTIEDPIEVIFKPKLCTISQKEVWKDTTTFYKWSKSCLRQDTQIVLLWELRTREEMEAAIDLATNWNLVFATTHSASVEDCFRYIYDSVPKERKDTMMQAFSSVLRWVLVQRMIQKPVVEETIVVHEETWEEVIEEKAVITYNIAYELLVNNMKLMKWLKQQENWLIDFVKIKHNIEEDWVTFWNISLNKSLLSLIIEWRIDIEDAMNSTYDKLWLKELILENNEIRRKFKDIDNYFNN